MLVRLALRGIPQHQRHYVYCSYMGLRAQSLHTSQNSKNDSTYDAFTLKEVDVVAVDGLAIDATADNLGGLKRLISHPWREGYFQRPCGVSGSSSRRRLKGPWPGWLKARPSSLLG